MSWSIAHSYETPNKHKAPINADYVPIKADYAPIKAEYAPIKTVSSNQFITGDQQWSAVEFHPIKTNYAPNNHYAPNNIAKHPPLKP